MNANRIPEEDQWRREDPSSDALRSDGRPASPTHRSGQYPALSGEGAVLESQSFEAPAPLPAEAAGRSEEDHPFRRPFASLLPGARVEDFVSPPASTPPSLRRPLSAAPPRRLGNCQRHRIALSPNGECVLCRREEKQTRGSARLLGLGALILAAIGTWFFFV